MDIDNEDSIPDLYHILGLTIDVCNKINCDEIIRKAYLKKAKVCHPDKNGGNKAITEIYQMLSEAYDILKDINTRESYNTKLIINRSDIKNNGNYKSLKESLNLFLKERELESNKQENIDDPTENLAKFKDLMIDLDKKNNFDRNNLFTPVNISIDKILENRNNEDSNLKPKNIFNENRNFDMDKFNAVFNFVNKDNKEKSMIPREDVESFEIHKPNYISLDNFEKLYVEDDSDYSSVNFTGGVNDLTEEDIEHINPINSKSWSHLEDNYYENIKSKLAERLNYFTAGQF